MMIHFGSRPYGTCDVVPELFYVATWFGHLNYIPLIPLQSNIVLGRNGNEYQVFPIPLDFKSICLTWMRLGSFVAAAACLIASLVWIGDKGPTDNALVAMLFTFFFGFFYAYFMIYPRQTKPPYERACKIAQMVRLNEKGWAALNVLYGRDPFDRPPVPENPPR